MKTPSSVLSGQVPEMAAEPAKTRQPPGWQVNLIMISIIVLSSFPLLLLMLLTPLIVPAVFFPWLGYQLWRKWHKTPSRPTQTNREGWAFPRVWPG